MLPGRGYQVPLSVRLPKTDVERIRQVPETSVSERTSGIHMKPFSRASM